MADPTLAHLSELCEACISDEKAKVAQLEEELNEAEKRCEVLKTEKMSLNLQVESLQNRNEDTEHLLSLARDYVCDIESEKTSLEWKLEALMQEVQILNITIAKNEQIDSHKVSEMEMMKKQLSESKARIKELEPHVANSSLALRATQAMKDLRTKYNESQQKVVDARLEMERLKSKLQLATYKGEQILEKCKERGKLLAESDSRLAEKDKRIEKLIREKGDLESIAQKKDVVIERCERDLKHAKEQFSERLQAQAEKHASNLELVKRDREHAIREHAGKVRDDKEGARSTYTSFLKDTVKTIQNQHRLSLEKQFSENNRLRLDLSQQLEGFKETYIATSDHTSAIECEKMKHETQMLRMKAENQEKVDRIQKSFKESIERAKEKHVRAQEDLRHVLRIKK